MFQFRKNYMSTYDYQSKYNLQKLHKNYESNLPQTIITHNESKLSITNLVCNTNNYVKHSSFFKKRFNTNTQQVFKNANKKIYY